jgi:hypothetical protein
VSASEKLKALDAEGRYPTLAEDLLPTLNYYIGPGARTATSRESELLYHRTARVLRALPQIVAVVEAAEVYAPIIWRRDAEDGHTKNGIELRRRLQALDEALP